MLALGQSRRLIQTGCKQDPKKAYSRKASHDPQAISEHFLFSAYWSAFAASSYVSILPTNPYRFTNHHCLRGAQLGKNRVEQNPFIMPVTLPSFIYCIYSVFVGKWDKGGARTGTTIKIRLDEKCSKLAILLLNVFPMVIFSPKSGEIKLMRPTLSISQNTDSFILDAKVKCN